VKRCDPGTIFQKTWSSLPNSNANFQYTYLVSLRLSPWRLFLKMTTLVLHKGVKIKHILFIATFWWMSSSLKVFWEQSTSIYLQSPKLDQNTLGPAVANKVVSQLRLLQNTTVSLKSKAEQICDAFHFAVTGFAKTGTTSMRRWLHAHEQIRMPSEEAWMRNKPQRLATRIQKIAARDEGQENLILGYEAPSDIRSPKVLKFYRSTCPQTKHIILIRHPVLWFESFYNYRRLHKDDWAIKDADPNKLIGAWCNGKSGYVCSDNGAFHLWLAQMGKTPMTSDNGELDLLAEFSNEIKNYVNHDDSAVFHNPVFLIETSQLSDPDPYRRRQLQRDMENYLGLQSPLGDVPHSNSGAALKESQKGKQEDIQGLIDICLPQNKVIHDKMMEIGRNASQWFRRYFIQSPEVVVSSRSHFESLLGKWNEDPCLERHNG
jgi:hypothetical protein